MNNDLYFFCLHDEVKHVTCGVVVKQGAKFHEERALISAALIMSAVMLSSAQESSGSS